MLKATQDPAGFWINSYWWNNGYGEEIRAHIGPCLWVALAVMNYEKLTGDMSYHDMAIKTIDWCLQFQKPNGGIGGGLTTWDSGNGSWTEEVWSSTEHNIDAYAALTYFSATTPSRQSTYSNAANKVKNFLDNVVWDNTKNRYYGGYRNNTEPWTLMYLWMSTLGVSWHLEPAEQETMVPQLAMLKMQTEIQELFPIRDTSIHCLTPVQL